MYSQDGVAMMNKIIFFLMMQDGDGDGDQWNGGGLVGDAQWWDEWMRVVRWQCCQKCLMRFGALN